MSDEFSGTTSDVPQSNMRSLGQVSVLGGLIACVCGFFWHLNVAGQYEPDHGQLLFSMATTSLGAVAVGIGALMWMLGVVEQRLIEIRERLPSNDASKSKE
jgi:nitrogen fixation-related uncharacterized protein